MSAPEQSSPPISGLLVTIMLKGLEKVIGPSYTQLLKGTPWQRYLTHPPSSDPYSVESNDEELGQVFGHIYRGVGKDLFIAFGRYAALEGGKTFADMLAPAIAPELVGLTGVARLQRMVEAELALVPWSLPLSASNTDDGVEIVYPNCAMCSGIRSDEPVCAYLADGMRSTFSRIGGEPVIVKEVVCQAQGKEPRCVFKITPRHG